MNWFSKKSFLLRVLILSSVILNTTLAMAQYEPKRRLSSLGFFEKELPPLPVFTKRELMTSYSPGSYTSTNQTANLNAVASLAWLVNRQIQVGGEGGINVVTNKGASATTFQMYFFGTYNFSARISNAYFVRAGWGFSSTSQGTNSSGSSSSSNNGFLFGLGRRFELWPHISYSPEFRIRQIEDSKTQVEIKALNFSVLF